VGALGAVVLLGFLSLAVRRASGDAAVQRTRRRHPRHVTISKLTAGNPLHASTSARAGSPNSADAPSVSAGEPNLTTERAGVQSARAGSPTPRQAREAAGSESTPRALHEDVTQRARELRQRQRETVASSEWWRGE
jgi:hypothetical protein